MQERGWRQRSEQRWAAPVEKVELGPSSPRTHCLTVRSVCPRRSCCRLQEGLCVSRADQWGEDILSERSWTQGGQWGTTPSPAELLVRQSAICKVLPRTRWHQGHRCSGALMEFPSLPEKEAQMAWGQLAQCLSSLLQILPPTAHTHTAFKLTFPVSQPTPPPC